MSDLHTLVVTTEHAATGKMGGIGSYNVETGELSSGTVFLVIDDTIENHPSESILVCKRYVSEHLPEYNDIYADFTQRDFVILQVALDILKKNPSIHQIASHEYGGIASRIAEAARTGVLAHDVRVRVHCHGGHVQLERATGDWLGSYLDVLNSERSSIENADEVWFPGTYLNRLYRASGMRVAEQDTRYLGLPYKLSTPVSDEDYTEVKNVAFIGRMNKLKGYDVFAKTVVNLLKQKSDQSKSIESITAIGNDDNSMGDIRRDLEKRATEAGISYSQGLKTRDDTLAYIREHAKDTVFVLPYYSDNYSVAMLELIDAGAPLLVLSTGGNAELLSSPLWVSNRIASDDEDLYRKCSNMLALSPKERKDECEALRHAFVKEQTIRNEDYANLFSPLHGWSRRGRSQGRDVVMAYLKVGYLDKGKQTDEWIVFDAKTGEQSRDLPSGVTHVFLSRKEIKYDDMLDALLKKAMVTGGVSERYSVGVSIGGKVNLLRNSSLGQFVQSPRENTLTNICLPVDDYIAFRDEYQVRASAGRSSAEYVFAALMYSSYAQNHRIVPVPTVAGKSPAFDYNTLEFDEVIFADFAHFQTAPQWESYRYAAILRHNIAQAELEHNRITTEYREILASPDKVGKIARKLIRRQLRAVSLAKNVKASIFRR